MDSRLVTSVLICMLFVLFFMPNTAQAGGFATIDNGTLRIGMKAVVGQSGDLSSIFSNPGAITELKGTRFYFSFYPTQIVAKFRMWDPETQTYSQTFRPTKSVGAVPYIAVSSDLGLKKWVFGLALYFPNISAAALPEDAPTKYHGVESYFINWYLTPVASYRLHPKISLGFGISHIYAIQYMRTRVDLYELIGVEGDGEIEAWPEDGGYVWNGGILFGPFGGLRIGMSYLSREILYMEGELKARSLIPELPLKAEGTYKEEKPIPESFRMGVNYIIDPRWDVGVDWTLWTFNIIKTTVAYIDGEWPLNMVEPMVKKKNYGNSWNIAIGARYAISDTWRWMWGIDIDHSPIPDKTFSVDNPTSSFWGVATGTLIELSENWTFGTSYSIQWQKERDIKDSITEPPTNVQTKVYNHKLAFSFSYHTR